MSRKIEPPHKPITQCGMIGCTNHYRCLHYEGNPGKQIPCPPMCPYQSWPTTLFRRKFWSREWVLK